MAKIGLKNLLFGVLTEGSTPSYGAAVKPAKAISCSVQITNNDVKLYADDALAESDTSFQSGTVTLGIDDEDNTVMATLLGHEISDGAMIRNSDDVAPYVGLGRIITKMVGGVLKYKVEFLKKVKFSEPNQTDNTKGETVAFGTSELVGTVACLADGSWSISKVFDTLTAAQTYLNGLFGERVSATVTYNVNGGSGTISAVSTYVGAVIDLDDGSGITPPSNKHFIGWDTTSTSTSADVKSPYTVEGNVTLYAIYASNA